MDKLKAIKCLSLRDEDRFVTNPSLTDVHIVSMAHLAWRKLFETRALIKDKYDEIIAFKPTAWCFKKLVEESTSNSVIVKDEGDRRIQFKQLPVNFSKRSNITVVDVPYSEHSSFNELKDCVKVYITNKLHIDTYP